MGKLIKFCKWFLEHSTAAVFKNENVKVKVKYSFVLHTGLAGRILYGLKRMVYFMNQSWFPVKVSLHTCQRLKLSQFSYNSTDVR